jgi:hypothetical protein
VIIKLKRDSDISYIPTSLTSIQYPSRHEILEVVVVSVNYDWMDRSFKKISALLEIIDNG